ncbi:hypothetical protein GQF03_14300 [Sneathiella chungangensis]|uniref:Uncharacterized protein n=1 Tax=Sneathiella chungangensis TaxID=1418234 RepID=A0A845MJL7_9PROT|nr:hypothetical protein [Sneathiella chungangensis]MZR23506.1 hypothetical protein [Sneathiella chungangensis]
MKSFLKAVSFALLFVLTVSTVQAASLHDENNMAAWLTKTEGIFDYFQSRETQNVLAFASEKFRNISSGKEISLSFDGKHSDPLGLSSRNATGGADYHHNDWIELMFGFQPWKFEDDEGFISISVHSTSSIPLPAALPLFAGGLAAFYLIMRRRRWRIR